MGPANINSDDFYDILGVARSASPDEIKKAYRKAAIKWHPDKNPNNDEAAENFKKIGEAYNILSDPEKRKLYDQFGKAAFQGGMPEPGAGGFPGGFPGGVRFGGGGGGGMSQEEARAMFERMFGGDDPFAAFFGGAFGGGGGGRRRGGASPFGGGGGGGGVRFVHVGGPGGGGGFGGFGGGGSPFGGGGFDEGFGGGGGSPFGGMGGGGGFGGGSPFGGGMGGMGGGMPRSTSNGMPSSMGGGPPDVIPPGTPVILKNLRSKPQLNGEMGEIEGYDPSTGRYIVRLDEGSTALKRENIQQIVEGVEITGLIKSPELNGQIGTLFDRDLTTDRYQIRLGRGKTVSVQPGNVILPIGTSVTIVGLTKGAHYNGRGGRITNVDRAAGRYAVEVSPTEHVRVKFENVRV